MLTGPKSFFKARQRVPDVKDRMLSHGSSDVGDKGTLGLRLLPGEHILQKAVLVRKKLPCREGGGWLAGTLFCTPFRVAFVPQDDLKRDEDTDPILLEDHDVALACVEKVVAVGPSRMKVMTPTSTLKFVPEELLLYCRDFQVHGFLFDRLTPEAQAMEITCAIAKVYQPLQPGALLTFLNAAFGSVEMRQRLSNRPRDATMCWFDIASDWETELERTGATGWRVSSINHRFEMAASLPRLNVVPQKVLDTQLKNTFAHFNEGRIPRWCWHHPSGSDLLRMASFKNNIYCERDNVRNLEALVFGSGQQCVVVELAEEMPTLADLQQGHARLRALCLADESAAVTVPDEKWLSSLESTRWLDHVRCCLRKATEAVCLLNDGLQTLILQEAEDRDMNCVVSSLVQVMCDPYCRTLAGFQGLVQKEWVVAGHRFLSRANYHRDREKEEAPVFLLFLDCVWQLWAQFPSRFQLTPEYLLAVHDSAHLPLFSSFLSNCELERRRRSKFLQLLPQCYTPVNGLGKGLPLTAWHALPDPPLPPVWDWALQYSSARRSRFTQPMTRPDPPPPLVNGSLNTVKTTEEAPASVFLFSRGTFTSPSNLLPWREGGGTGLSKRSLRRDPPSESPLAPDWLLKAWTLAENPGSGTLIPQLLAPCVGLWKDCYFRGVLQVQVRCYKYRCGATSTGAVLQVQAFRHPEATSSHPVDQLAREVQQLMEELALASAVGARGLGQVGLEPSSTRMPTAALPSMPPYTTWTSL
nr:myotubularin-related protein 11-like isoform X1 [Paramormyrops kingsleyae]